MNQGSFLFSYILEDGGTRWLDRWICLCL